MGWAHHPNGCPTILCCSLGLHSLVHTSTQHRKRLDPGRAMKEARISSVFTPACDGKFEPPVGPSAHKRKIMANIQHYCNGKWMTRTKKARLRFDFKKAKGMDFNRHHITQNRRSTVDSWRRKQNQSDSSIRICPQPFYAASEGGTLESTKRNLREQSGEDVLISGKHEGKWWGPERCCTLNG